MPQLAYKGGSSVHTPIFIMCFIHNITERVTNSACMLSYSRNQNKTPIRVSNFAEINHRETFQDLTIGVL